MNEQEGKEFKKFIHTVSHDLQAPLSKIITISELLTERLKDIDETDREYLLKMHEAGKRMKGMIDELVHRSDV